MAEKGGGGGYSLDSTTAHSDAVSQTVGGNSGISFGSKTSTTEKAIYAGVLIVLAIAYLKLKGKKKGGA